MNVALNDIPSTERRDWRLVEQTQAKDFPHWSQKLLPAEHNNSFF